MPRSMTVTAAPKAAQALARRLHIAARSPRYVPGDYTDNSGKTEVSGTSRMKPALPLSAALIGAWRANRPLEAEEAARLAPANEAEAYRVQHEVADALGWFRAGRPRAWKIGAASRDAQPTAAPIADDVVLQSPARLKAESMHTLIGVEVELAICLARPLPNGAGAEQVNAAVGEVRAAIEICDVRAKDWPALPPLVRLADQQMNRWLILGGGIRGPWCDELANSEVQLAVNGEETIRRRGGHPLGAPLFLLAWLARHAAGRHPGGLQAGDIITTGTWTGLYEAKPGDHIQASFDGIGSVEVEIGAI